MRLPLPSSPSTRQKSKQSAVAKIKVKLGVDDFLHVREHFLSAQATTIATPGVRMMIPALKLVLICGDSQPFFFYRSKKTPVGLPTPAPNPQ